jgi:predicted RNA-binding Zn-ribbon protein involved in translation (DUF1610 family)
MLLGKFCLFVLFALAAVVIAIELLDILQNTDYLPMSWGLRIIACAIWGGLCWLIINLMYGRLLPQFGLRCTQCGKFASADLKWVCGFCSSESTDERGYSFIIRCETCRQETKAFICPHCEAINFIDADHEGKNAARFVGKGRPKPPTVDVAIEKEREHRERKRELEREIEITALDRRLTKLKESPEFKQEVSEREKIEKGFSDYQASIMGIQLLERKRRLEYEKEFADDADLLEMQHLTLDAYVEKFGLTPNRNYGKEKGSRTGGSLE